jgi:hypothetical protein
VNDSSVVRAQSGPDRAPFGEQRRRQLDQGTRCSVVMTVADDSAAGVTPDVSVTLLMKEPIDKRVPGRLGHIVYIHDADKTGLKAMLFELWRKVEEEILIASHSMRKDAHTNEYDRSVHGV